MKIISATRVATLAIGLSLAAGQAYADPQDGRRNRDDATQQQQQQNNNDRGDGRHRRGNNNTPPAAGPQAPAAQQGPANNGRWQDRHPRQVGDDRRVRGRGDRSNDRGNNTWQQNNNDRRRGDWNNNDRRNNNPVVRNDDRRDRNWGNNDRNRNWGNQDRRRYDVTRYNRNFNSTRRFRVDSYRQPYGYSYRRWNYGQRLPRNYYVRHFWLTNFLVYGLFAPPPGYVWVRYGPDALLIDEETGEIVQVRYNMFYS